MKRILGIVLLVLMAASVLSSCGKKKNSLEEYFEENPAPEIEYRDAEEYYQENGELISSSEIKESDFMMSESEVCLELSGRGFSEEEILTSYDQDGNIIEELEISSSSGDKHPVYDVLYLSENGILWHITVIGDSVVANPVSYNLSSTKNAMTVITESDTITSYDSATRKYFITVPSESALITKKVERIDAATLDSLTMEDLDA